MKHYHFILAVCALALTRTVIAQDSTAGTTINGKTAAASMPSRALAKVFDAKDGEEKEQAYEQLLSQFPAGSPGAGGKIYNYAREAVAMGYIRQNNLPKAIQYTYMIDPGAYRISVEGRVANSLMARNKFEEAEQMLQDGITSAEKMLAQGDETAAKGVRGAYAVCCNTYADLLYRQKKYTPALKYIQLADENATVPAANHNGLYAEILVALGRDQEAFDIIDKSLKAGKVTVSMRKELEILYPKDTRPISRK